MQTAWLINTYIYALTNTHTHIYIWGTYIVVLSEKWSCLKKKKKKKKKDREPFYFLTQVAEYIS